MVQPAEEIIAEEIIEKAVKPEVEEKIERAIEEFEETEITLDCEKQQEQEMIHNQLKHQCACKRSKDGQPAEEIIAEEIIEKAVKPEVEEKIERAIEEFEETEITLIAKNNRTRNDHVSILTGASESAQASVRLAKNRKPEVEEKIERAIEEFEETEITLDCEKQQEQEMIHVSILTVASESAQASVRLAKEEQEMIHVSILTVASESAQASVRLAKEVKMVQPAEEEIIEKAVKPEVEEKIERAIEEFEETEITLDCEKTTGTRNDSRLHSDCGFRISSSISALSKEEQEMIHSLHSDCGFRISSSISALARSKMVQPAEEIIAEEIIEKAVKPEVEEKIERAIEEFEETEITLDCEKQQEQEIFTSPF
uniref:A-kinase anchor protein 2-like n=1 Tax=Loa loa TaxID=7209 RepID=A0A1I7W4T0_LOALO